MILRKLFKKKPTARELPEESSEERVSVETRPAQVGERPLVLGVISGKGGCGKSIITVNMAYLISALYGSSMVIDLDIINATSTDTLFATEDNYEILATDDGVSTLDYMIEGAEEYHIYKLSFPPNYRPSIQVAGRPEEGVAIKDIYILPAKKLTGTYKVKIQKIGYLTPEEIQESLRTMYNRLLDFARRNKVPVVILDFPPFHPDRREVFTGVFYLLELIPWFIAVTSFNAAAVHGLISILTSRYGYLSKHIRGILVNMATDNEDLRRSIESYVSKYFGEGLVHFIRWDRWWRVTEVPPIILEDPSTGASRDLIVALVKMGIIDAKTVEDNLGFKPV